MFISKCSALVLRNSLQKLTSSCFIMMCDIMKKISQFHVVLESILYYLLFDMLYIIIIVIHPVTRDPVALRDMKVFQFKGLESRIK